MSDRTSFIEVICCHCNAKFNKTLHRYKEAIKNKWNFFCSRKCQSEFKNKSLMLKCFECDKDIVVLRNQYETSVSKRFFCSKKCSAKYNNILRGPKSQEEKNKIKNSMNQYYRSNGNSRVIQNKVCMVCNKNFKTKLDNQFCCSRTCGVIYQFGSLPHTKEYVVNTIIEIAKLTSRTPQYRDCESRLHHAAVRFFGTWNRTMESCGLKPNHSKYQKTRLKCKDGHIVDSISEKIIDEWLFSKNIKHEKNKKYPNSNMNCDFYLNDYDVWVEYFGLYGGGIEEYDDAIKDKEIIVKNNNLNFVSLKPFDLYEDKSKSYGEKLEIVFSKYF